MMEDDPGNNNMLTLYGLLLAILGTMVAFLISMYLFINGEPVFLAIIVGVAMIVSGFLMAVIDAWMEVKRLQNMRDLDVRLGKGHPRCRDREESYHLYLW